MALAVFNQFPQLTRFFAQLARAAARKECVREFNRLDLSTGAATMKDRAMNVAALAGGEVTVTVPDTDPGKARDFGHGGLIEVALPIAHLRALHRADGRLDKRHRGGVIIGAKS